jgi:hypothetical protein
MIEHLQTQSVNQHPSDMGKAIVAKKPPNAPDQIDAQDQQGELGALVKEAFFYGVDKLFQPPSRSHLSCRINGEADQANRQHEPFRVQVVKQASVYRYAIKVSVGHGSAVFASRAARRILLTKGWTEYSDRNPWTFDDAFPMMQ